MAQNSTVHALQRMLNKRLHLRGHRKLKGHRFDRDTIAELQHFLSLELPAMDTSYKRSSVRLKRQLGNRQSYRRHSSADPIQEGTPLDSQRPRSRAFTDTLTDPYEAEAEAPTLPEHLRWSRRQTTGCDSAAK